MTTARLAADQPRVRRWIRPKGRLSARTWLAIGGLAALAAGVALAKLAGATALADAVTLGHLAPTLQARLGHLFVVPVGALVIALARLTLNLRMLGPFRAILLAMAFESVGYGLGLVFFALVTGLVMVLRPWTRRIGLPYYGRVLTMVSAVTCIMALVLVAASASGAADLTRVAYFPIIVLALTGDTSSRIVAREGVGALARRFLATVVAGVAIAALVGLEPLRAALIAYPELLVLQVVALIVISELFDVRLLGDDAPPPARRRQRPGPTPVTDPTLLAGPLRVAVVRNRSRRGVLGRATGRRAVKAYSRKGIQRVLDALRSAGFAAEVFEGDVGLHERLRTFLPVDPRTKRVRGVVLNLADGIQGMAPGCHVPAMLELAGVPYTGAGPLGRACCADLFLLRQSLRAAGLPTPRAIVHREVGASIGELEFPLVVRPRDAGAARLPRLVSNRAELDVAVHAVLVRCRCEAIVESHLEGRRLTVTVLGDAPARALPVVETVAGADGHDHRLCPAPLDDERSQRLQALAVGAAKACGARDLSRVDIVIDQAGDAHVVFVHVAPSIAKASAATEAARRGGYRYAAFLRELVRSACERSGLTVSDAAPVNAP